MTRAGSGAGKLRVPDASGDDARTVALRVLVRVERDLAWSNRVLPAELGHSRLAPRDRAMVTDLVRSTLRWQSALDALLEMVVSRPLPSLDVEVRQALRLGAYQLTIGGTPPHAAVSTTVAALQGHPGGRLVNASLRALARAGEGGQWPWPGDPVALSFPEWLRPRWPRSLMEALQRPAPTHVRLRAGREAEAEARLPKGSVPGSIVASVRRLEGGGDPGPLVRAGLVTVQDEGSAAVAWAARPVEGGPVLDLAAGPGGKSTALAEWGHPVLAVDLMPGRARAVVRSGERLGLDHLAVTVADGRRLPVRTWPAGGTILLDAPCTGLGTLRRRPEIRHRVRPSDPERLAVLQADLLRAAAGALPRGGVLIYSVCTLTTEETVEVAASLAELAELASIDPPVPTVTEPLIGEGPGGFLLPSVHGTDGMYLACLKRG